MRPWIVVDALTTSDTGRIRLGALIHDTRLGADLSMRQLAVRMLDVRQNEQKPPKVASLISLISRWENGHQDLDAASLRVLAQALDGTVASLFGIELSEAVPRARLTPDHVTEASIALLADARRVHIRTEHMFGPRLAATQVKNELAHIDELLRVVPDWAVTPLHREAALTAELAGWIAHESGEVDTALSLTTQAHAHALVANDAAVQAMIAMRWSNIVTPNDPQIGRILALNAARTASTIAPSRLHAAIARQQAHAAALLADKKAFANSSTQSADYARITEQDGDLVVYAGPNYVASEKAAALLLLDDAAGAVKLLTGVVSIQTPGQDRDDSVTSARLLQALTANGDRVAAMQITGRVINAYRCAPSIRAQAAIDAASAAGPHALRERINELQRENMNP